MTIEDIKHDHRVKNHMGSVGIGFDHIADEMVDWLIKEHDRLTVALLDAERERDNALMSETDALNEAGRARHMTGVCKRTMGQGPYATDCGSYGHEPWKFCPHCGRKTQTAK